jgi:hypothetical protein
MRKLHNVGIRGRLYDWIADFLKDRMQCVQVDGSSSKVQTTVLGPLLFIIYVNDLEKAARNALMAAFADDTRLSKAICGAATEEDMFGGWSKALLALLAPLKVWHLTKFWDDRG